MLTFQRGVPTIYRYGPLFQFFLTLKLLAILRCRSGVILSRRSHIVAPCAARGQLLTFFNTPMLYLVLAPAPILSRVGFSYILGGISSVVVLRVVGIYRVLAHLGLACSSHRASFESLIKPVLNSKVNIMLEQFSVVVKAYSRFSTDENSYYVKAR